MENKKNILCGGTFFSLLYEARKTVVSPKEQYNGKKTKITSSNMLEDLIKIIDPTHVEIEKNSMKKYTSDFKSCKINYSSNIPFNDPYFEYKFRDQIENNYDELLKKMRIYIIMYLDYTNPTKMDALGHRLLALILDDETNLQDSDILLDGSEYMLNELEDFQSVVLSSLILGIYFYIIEYPKNNKEGRETYNNWYPKNIKYEEDKYKLAKFASNIGDNYKYIDIETFDLLEEIKGPQIIKGPDKICKYKNYYTLACNDLQKIKTILNRDNYVNFYDMYVAPTITSHQTRSFSYPGKYMSSYYYTTCFGRYTSITGNAGQGKSMFLKHLFLCDSIAEKANFQKCNLIPILIEVRKYNSEKDSLEKMLYKAIQLYDSSITEKEFFNDLKDGGFLLLFDALDEIKLNAIDDFFNQLNIMTNKYPSNYYITTSRPYEHAEALRKFQSLKLENFNEERATKMILKIPNRDLEIKNNFVKMLKKEYFEKYYELASNPLLLSIMFLVFERFERLPEKPYQFYDEAFETLYYKHDKIKGYTRHFYTTQSKSELQSIISKFSFLTFSDQKYSFSNFEIEETFLNKIFPDYIDSDNFIKDMEENLNLFYLDTGMYTFLHRSFQEYFTARYFNFLIDDEYKKFPEWAEEISSDKTSRVTFDEYKDENDVDFDIVSFNENFVKEPFVMFSGANCSSIIKFLYDMNPSRFKRLILIPYLRKLISREESINSYLSFIKSALDVIYITVRGNTTMDSTLLSSFLKLINMDKMFYIPYHEEIPELSEYISEELYGIYYTDEMKQEKECDLLLKEEIESILSTMTPTSQKKWISDQKIDFNHPECYTYELDINELINNPTENQKAINYLYSDENPIKQNYKKLRHLIGYK